MKREIFVFMSIMLFYISTSWASEGNILLKPEEGRIYGFKKVIIQSEFIKERQYIESITENKFEFSIESVSSDKIIFSSIFLSGIIEQVNDPVKSLYNIKFPPVVDDINQRNSFIEVFSSLLMLVKIKCEIDLINNIIRQINKEEMLQEMQSILKRKRYTDEFRLLQILGIPG